MFQGISIGVPKLKDLLFVASLSLLHDSFYGVDLLVYLCVSGSVYEIRVVSGTMSVANLVLGPSKTLTLPQTPTECQSHSFVQWPF